MNAEKVLFSLLRAAVCDKPVADDVKAVLTEDMLQSVGILAKQHDLAHLLQQAVSKLGLPESPMLNQFKKAEQNAVFRYLRMVHDYQQLCEVLENAQIAFIPLKGSVLRNDYPEPWMRTSCDVDILVKEDQLELAENVLKKELKYVEEGKTDHDISLFSPAGVHLELHYDTMPECYEIFDSSAVMSRVWEDVVPKHPGAFLCCMSDAMFYFYHIAHMAKHLKNGGCGIRSFLDLWILNHRVENNAAERKQLLIEGDLLTFEETATRLAEVWFSGVEPDALTTALEQFVLNGGVYGTLRNTIVIKQDIKGGKLRYALQRIYIPYDTIKYYYPVLQKHKWLTPFYQVVRWCKLVFKGGWRRAAYELHANATVSREEVASVAKLMHNLGLK